MLPKPAQYLLRFDDLCPTVSRERWQRFLPLLEEHRLRPILAVVPENHDPDLKRGGPDPAFWRQMKALEAAGSTIALHGFHHLCRSKGRSLVPLHSHSEFAGVPGCTQQLWISSGLEILRAHGLNPRLWVAPRHGFDRNTLLALRGEGIRMISDGFARVPFTRGGLIWIPQQLWDPVEKSSGLWTICIHPNSAGDSFVDRLRRFLLHHAAQFTSVDRVVEELKPAQLSPAERAREILALWKVRVSRTRRNTFSRKGNSV